MKVLHFKQVLGKAKTGGDFIASRMAGQLLLCLMLLAGCSRSSSPSQSVALADAPQKKVAIEAFATLPTKPSLAQYLERIHGLTVSVSPEQQRALITWISGPKPAHVPDSDWPYIANEIMDKLCLQDHPVPELSPALISLATNPRGDIVLRDFSLQHIVPLVYPDNATSPFETDRDRRQALIATLLDAAAQTKESFSGTALQGFNIILANRERAEKENERSAQFPISFEVGQLRTLAIQLAAGMETCDSARITALQLCASRGFQEALPIARKLATDNGQPVCVRISAIAAIGMLGSPEDKALLERLLDQQNVRLSKAIKPAIGRLSARKITNLN